MDGWKNLGAAFGGDSEKSYQEGMLTGAQTENALAQAAERVAKNKARLQLADQLEAAGIPRTTAEASAGALTAGGNLGDVVTMRDKQQEYDFRARAGDPNTPIGDAQRAMLAVSSGPTEPLYKVGNGYANKFDNNPSITPLGDAVGGGGDSATVQALRAFGLLGPDGRVLPGKEELAFNIMRNTERTVDLGNVPGRVSANPFSANPGVAVPVTPTSTVAANTAETARAKEVGTGTGKAQMAAGGDLAEVNKLRNTITNFRKMPGFAGAYGNIQGQPVVRSAAGLLDQDIADAQATLTNLDSQTFGIAIDTMKGLGALSNAEGSRVTSAFTVATNPLVSERVANAAWDEVLYYLDLAEKNIQAKAGGSQMPGGAAPSAAPAPVAPTAAPAAAPAVTLDSYLKSKGY